MLKSILLIDDNEVTQFITRHLLEELQVARQVEICRNAEDALEYLAGPAPAPELILLDLNMPGLDGFGFLEQFEKQFRRRKYKPYIAVYTTSAREQDKARAEQFAAVIAYLEKPLNAEKLKLLSEKLEAATAGVK